MDAVASFDFDAREGDELSFSIGAVIHDIKVIDEGWAEGTLKGKRGTFPRNYVRMREIEENDQQDLGVVALYDYDALGDGEVGFRKGDVILNVLMIDEGGAEGDLNGKRGFIPFNYVKVRPLENPQGAVALNDAHHEERMQRNKLNVFERQEAVALQDYATQDLSIFSFKRGDVIQGVIKTDAAWAEGTLDGKRGSFPQSFVRMRQPEEYVQQVAITKHDYDGQDDSMLSFSGGDVIRDVLKIDVAWAKGELNGTIALFPLNFVVMCPVRDDWEVEFDAVVLFDYHSGQSNELELKVGDFVHNIEEIEEGLLEGEVKGRRGIFPAAFVRMKRQSGSGVDSDDLAG